MKLTCTQENLTRGLNIVSHIANKNNNLPILNNVLLRADKDGLTLITTDLEIGIKVFVRGKVDKAGEFTVAAKLLNDFVNLLPKENIDIELKDKSLKIKSKNQTSNIKGMVAEDFPLIPGIEETGGVEIAINDFKQALAQTVFAASLDSGRAEINAVSFSFDKDQLILASTDSYRLAEKKLSVNNKETKDLIVPLKVIQELVRILGDQTGKNLKICFNENQIKFVFDGVELTSRVVEGKYPDYQQIIPDKFTTTAKTPVSRLVPAIKSAALFCKQGINDVRLNFDVNNKEIIITTASSQLGESTIKVSADIVGQSLEAVFNFRYLLDGLSNLNDTEVVIKVNSDNSPGLLQPSKNNNYLYLVMPIRQ